MAKKVNVKSTGMSKKEVLDLAKRENVQFVQLQFTDLNGLLKGVTIPISKLDGAIDDGLWFDGSSVEGFMRIFESDMYLKAVLLEDPAIMTAAIEGAGDGEPNALIAGFTMMRQTIPMLQQSGVTLDALVGILAESPGLDGRPFKDTMYPDAIVAMASGLLRLDASVLDPALDGTLEAVFDPHAAIPAPGIVLAGDETDPSTIVRGREKALLAANSPHVDVRIVSGAGHMIHDAFEHREVMRAALWQLLASP